MDLEDNFNRLSIVRQQQQHNNSIEQSILLQPQPTTIERWFHGSVGGLEAEKLIMDKGMNGSFLVRNSKSKVGDYVLTVRTKDETTQSDKVTHVIIRNRNGKYDVGGGQRFDSLTELVNHYKKNPMVETSGTVVNMKYPFNSTKVEAYLIDGRVEELSKLSDDIESGKDGFWEEFEQLQHQECKVLFNRKVGQELRNINKNRYKNILPYDYTRVILNKTNLDNQTVATLVALNQNNNQQQDLTSDVPEDSDYINASHIKLVDEESQLSPQVKPVPFSKRYIATQGPLQNTIDDFWLMIWQQQVSVIIMVTQEVERGKNKCCKYWPNLNSLPMYCKQIKVETIVDSSSQSGEDINFTDNGNKTAVGNNNNYVYREFVVTFETQARKVAHWHYTAWSDLNIPSDPTNILDFLEDINSHRQQASTNKSFTQNELDHPIVVHCSAGIGRSGTLIVIDMIIDQLKNNLLTYEIDIQRIVRTVRAQRSGLVQTETQYKFVYLAIQNYISKKKEKMLMTNNKTTKMN